VLGAFSRRRLVTAAIVVVTLPLLWGAAKLIKTKHSDYWFPSYARDLVQGRYGSPEQTEHLFLLMCDHWEPGRGAEGLTRADHWLDAFESIADEHRDTQGRIFQYSWFYPIDNLEPAVLDRLADSVFEGYGEIEVHWHHRHDDSASFARDLSAALPEFTRVGALISEPDIQPRFAFIHGNWTLDNSGAPRLCGISDEISILQRHGCYADFTFPALGTSAQPSTINRVFYALDTSRPKSYEENPVLARAGRDGTGLMLIPGPLGLDFRNPLVLIEYAALDDAEGTGLTGKLGKPEEFADYFRPHRVDLWNRLGVGVEGVPEWVFVKIHAHGVQHRDIVLGGEMDAMLTAVEDYCRKRQIQLHYVTAREAFNLVKAAEKQLDGPPQRFYDLVIPPPLNRSVRPEPSSASNGLRHAQSESTSDQTLESPAEEY